MQAASKPLIGCLSESVRASTWAEIIASRIPWTKAVGNRGVVEGRMVAERFLCCGMAYTQGFLVFAARLAL